MNRKLLLSLSLSFALTIGVTIAQQADPSPTPPTSPGDAKGGAGGRGPSMSSMLGGPRKFGDFAELTKDSTRYDGLFTLHKKDDNLYAEIKLQQLNQSFLAPITIAKGLAQAGTPITSDDEWVLVFKRVGDRIQLIRRNIHFKTSNKELEKAVEQNYTDSIIQSLPILALNPMGGSVVINFTDIFFGNFAQLPFGSPDRNRTSWNKIKTFPNNVELQVEATFAGRGDGDPSVVDSRGVTLVIHYSLCKLPDGGYRPRMADNRIGHFLSAVKDFGSKNPDTQFVRQINRWNLEKSNSKAKLSPPKKQIVWWVEDTVPIELRPHVEAGILEWNKAFEKVGIANAIAVRWQNERDDFDPEDINYCTLKWITTDSTFARSNLRANPLTGEMIDGDVVFDASWIRAWKEQYAQLKGLPVPVSAPGEEMRMKPVLGEVISPILAARKGFGMPSPILDATQVITGERPLHAIPAEWSSMEHRLHQHLGAGQSACNLAAGIGYEMTLAALTFADPVKKDEPKKEEPKKEKETAPALPEELIGQAIKEVVMHEVGHSLGLRHNFRASAMLTADQLHDTKITHEKGLAGSVMDYTPINIASKGKTQGDYFSTTIGPYDYWAIEYAYKQVDGNEETELAKIAARSAEQDLTYGTDEDRISGLDPLVNAYDLGSDLLRFSSDRMDLAQDLLKDLDSRVVKDGESWTRLRRAFTPLVSQWGNAAGLASGYVGGQLYKRDHKGTKDGMDPVTPVYGDMQRAALKLIRDKILNDNVFQVSPALLRKLTSERWYHWAADMNAGDPGYKFYDTVLSIQRIPLSETLSASTLNRIQNQEAMADASTKPLKIEELFRTFTDSIIGDMTISAVKDGKRGLTITRRNLQREYVGRLSGMLLGSRGSAALAGLPSFITISGGGGSMPADARSLARMHLKEISAKIDAALASKNPAWDDTTKAHLEELKVTIDRVLSAGIQRNEP
ncbi:MAG: zinc-dependent metalloprotease [Planctomycetota bacterium]